MPRITFVHRDTLLAMCAAMPARRSGESAASFDKRKSAAAKRLTDKYGLQVFRSESTRANQYRESEVVALSQRIVHLIAA